MNNKWEYGEYYKKYNMKGIIKLPYNSKVKVSDLILEMPEFMKDADIIFSDPPCSQGNLTSFYTKADKLNENTFGNFYRYFFKRIDEINPKQIWIEVFKSNKNIFIKECQKRYKNINIYDSKYYNNNKNICWIIQCSNGCINYYDEINGMDEEKIIEWICKNIDYDCIGDLCMGKGLVGKYSFLNNKKFVGIELNKKRLAVLVDFIYRMVNK